MDPSRWVAAVEYNLGDCGVGHHQCRNSSRFEMSGSRYGDAHKQPHQLDDFLFVNHCVCCGSRVVSDESYSPLVIQAP